ncbi:tRNA (adenosine(37)-N6)-threonylcarbamoyltransferase complex transferase subunit TsaD, partial [Nocardia sp. NPDC058497]
LSFQRCCVFVFCVRGCALVGRARAGPGAPPPPNSRIRSLAEERCTAAGLTLRVPKPRLCTDNGVMIAALGAHVIAAGAQPAELTVATDPGLPVSVSALRG